MTTFEFQGIILSEPITAFTNLLLAVLCTYAYFQVKIYSDFNGRTSWGYFFLFLGISTLAGAFAHLFSAYDMLAVNLFGWSFSGFSAYHGINASIEQLTGKVTGLNSFLTKITFVLFLITLFWLKVFAVVLVITIIFIVVTVTIQGYGSVTKKLKGSGLILIGFLLATITAVLRLLKISIDPQWVNHHDVAHILMMVVIWLILRGVRKASIESEISMD